MADGIRSDETDIVTDIVEQLAAARGTDPLELSPPLEHVVDTDALQRLVDCDGTHLVEFEYGGHVVTVDGDGAVTVRGAGSVTADGTDASISTLGQ
jgi:hypothetical protein